MPKKGTLQINIERFVSNKPYYRWESEWASLTDKNCPNPNGSSGNCEDDPTKIFASILNHHEAELADEDVKIVIVPSSSRVISSVGASEKSCWGVIGINEVTLMVVLRDYDNFLCARGKRSLPVLQFPEDSDEERGNLVDRPKPVSVSRNETSQQRISNSIIGGG